MTLPCKNNLLLSLARETLEQAFLKHSKKNLFSKEIGSCFISLKKNTRLRGCSGTVFPFQSLVDDVQFNTLQAAFHDPRFDPLLYEELPSVLIELSILTPPIVLETTTEKKILEQLRPHLDGVVLQWKDHKSTFLPSVWEIFPEKKDFFSALKKKAGLEESFWAKDLEIFIYTVSTYKEET